MTTTATRRLLLRAADETYLLAIAQVRDHDPVSVGYCLAALEGHARLLGKPAALDAMARADFPQLGAPKLAAFAKAAGFAPPAGIWWVRMSTGEPCSPRCTRGCAQLAAGVARLRTAPADERAKLGPNAPVSGVITAKRARRDQVRGEAMRVLRGEYPLPISTVALGDKLGLNGYERQALLYPFLNQLANRGRLERMAFEDLRCRFWRLAEVTEGVSRG